MLIFRLLELANTIAMIGGAYVVFQVIGIAIINTCKLFKVPTPKRRSATRKK